MLKKVLAITLAVIMIICVLSVTAFAEGEGGEPETPVTEIYTIEDLYMINYDLGGNFKLMNDIDMTEATAEGGDWDYIGNGWEPIGSNGIYSRSTPFTGTFDGNGYKIIGMRINISSLPSGTAGDVYAGLFAKNTGTIKNLSMFGSIESKYAGYYGSIAGQNDGTILSCVNNMSITITSSSSGLICAGGIAGYTYKGTVSECCNNGDVSVKGSSYSVYSSGITVCDGGTVTDCYNTGSITAAHSVYSDRAYSAGISADYDLIPTISNCYNIGTAKKAISYKSVTNCYFLSGIGEDTTGAKSLTAAQMKIKGIYGGFDFDNVWFIDNTAEYPYPQLRSLALQPAEDPTEAPTDAPTEAPTEAPTQAPVIIILGDVDGDLDVGIIDATFIQRYSAGFSTPYAIGEPIELG